MIRKISFSETFALMFTTWKVSVFGVILVCISPNSEWRREIRSISPYSVQMQENVDQNNSEEGHFLRSGLMVDQ